MASATSKGVLPKHPITSTPRESLKNPPEQFDFAVNSAIDLIDKCIKSSEDLKRLCTKFKSSGDKLSTTVINVIDFIGEDTRAIMEMKAKIIELKEGVKTEKIQSLKSAFQAMINNVESISNREIQMFSDVLCLREASNVKKRLEATEKEIKTINEFLTPDDRTRKFAATVFERNRKLINCLECFYQLLANSFHSSLVTESLSTKITLNKSKSPKKLYILGESLQQQLPMNREKSLIGRVEIEDETAVRSSHRSTSRVESGQQEQGDYRRLLSGFLLDDVGNLEEVALELEEPIGDLMNFSESISATQRKLTARVEINGEPINESLPVVEIDLSEELPSEEAAKVIALVENKAGQAQKVEISLVPTSPGQKIHGKIIEIQPAVRDVHNKSLESTRFPKPSKRYDPNVTGIYDFNRFNSSRKINSKVKPLQAEELADVIEPNYENFEKNISRATAKTENLYDISEPNFSELEDSSEKRSRSARGASHRGILPEISENLIDVSQPNFSDLVESVHDEQQISQTAYRKQLPEVNDEEMIEDFSEPSSIELDRDLNDLVLIRNGRRTEHGSSPNREVQSGSNAAKIQPGQNYELMDDLSRHVIFQQGSSSPLSTQRVLTSSRQQTPRSRAIRSDNQILNQSTNDLLSNMSTDNRKNLREKTLNKSFPLRSNDSSKRRLNQSLGNSRDLPTMPVDLGMPSNVLRRVPTRLPESATSLPRFDVPRIHVDEKTYQRMDEMLNKPLINYIKSPEVPQTSQRLNRSLLREPEPSSFVQNRNSLPSRLKLPQRGPQQSNNNDLSLNEAYNMFQSVKQAEQNRQKLHVSQDVSEHIEDVSMGSNDSFEATERMIEAEEAQKEAYYQKIREAEKAKLAAQGLTDYVALPAAAFAERLNVSEQLDDIMMDLVEDVIDVLQEN